MTATPRHLVRSTSTGVLAMLVTLLLSGSMLGSINGADDNAGYELTGGIEQWETTIMLGGGLELTGHIEPMWEGIQHTDDQSCDDIATSASPAMHDSRVHAEPSPRRVVPDADAIIELVRMWGVCSTASCGTDLTGDGLVETADLMTLLFSDASRVAATSGER